MDPTERNLEVNVERVNDWKAQISAAKSAWMSGDRKAAEAALLSALDKSAYFGAESPPVATSLYNLAELYRRCQRLSEATPLYERALRIFEKTAGRTHRTTTTCIASLAEVSRENGKLARATELHLDVVTRLRDVVTEEPKRTPGLASALLRLGEVRLMSKDVQGAHTAFEEAVWLCEVRWGEHDKRTAPARARLAEVLLQRGQAQAALEQAERGLAALDVEGANRERLEKVLLLAEAAIKKAKLKA